VSGREPITASGTTAQYVGESGSSLITGRLGVAGRARVSTGTMRPAIEASGGGASESLAATRSGAATSSTTGGVMPMARIVEGGVTHQSHQLLHLS
jgi:hypothetical protein